MPFPEGEFDDNNDDGGDFDDDNDLGIVFFSTPIVNQSQKAQ